MTCLYSLHQTKELVTEDKNIKNKNILQDIANVQNSLTKVIDVNNPNLYKGSQFISKTGRNEERMETTKCVCDDLVFLEDPNDPRGCIYFQVRLILCFIFLLSFYYGS